MKAVSFLLSYFSIFFNYFILTRVYQGTVREKIRYTITHYSILIMISIITIICNNTLPVLLKIPTSFVMIMIAYKRFYNENTPTILLKTIIIYFLLIICDILVSTIFLFFPIVSVLDLGKINFIKSMCTILVSLFLMIIFLSKKFIRFINKLLNYIIGKKNTIIMFLMIFSFIVFVILAIFSATSFDTEIYLITILLISFFVFLCIVLIVQYFKNKHSEEEQKTLLNLMNEYENILEKDKMNRHEMLNNLIVIKSFKDKNSKEYEGTLNEIIQNYEDKKSKIYTNLYKLPSGIKGVIYYRITKIRESKINLNLLCASDIDKYFEDLEEKLYYKVCKILGIVLDNAIEAAAQTDSKILIIDIYEEKFLKIYIENTFKNDIDINTIYEKGFSSKGNNRGYGLYIVNKILKETNNIKFSQSIENNRFITEISIKKILIKN